jgi:hypothetical protein
MKKILVMTGFTVFLFPLIIAGSQIVDSNTQDEFRHLEQQMLDSAATPDLPALRRMLADDFMGTAFGAKVLSKGDIVPPDGSDSNHLQKFTLGQSTVHLYGDTAVLMGNATPDNRSGNELRLTTVFQKRPAGWQIIAIHMSPVPK